MSVAPVRVNLASSCSYIDTIGQASRGERRPVTLATQTDVNSQVIVLSGPVRASTEQHRRADRRLGPF